MILCGTRHQEFRLLLFQASHFEGLCLHQFYSASKIHQTWNTGRTCSNTAAWLLRSIQVSSLQPCCKRTRQSTRNSVMCEQSLSHRSGSLMVHLLLVPSFPQGQQPCSKQCATLLGKPHPAREKRSEIWLPKPPSWRTEKYRKHGSNLSNRLALLWVSSSIFKWNRNLKCTQWPAVNTCSNSSGALKSWRIKAAHLQTIFRRSSDFNSGSSKNHLRFQSWHMQCIYSTQVLACCWKPFSFNWSCGYQDDYCTFTRYSLAFPFFRNKIPCSKSEKRATSMTCKPKSLRMRR